MTTPRQGFTAGNTLAKAKEKWSAQKVLAEKLAKARAFVKGYPITKEVQVT